MKKASDPQPSLDGPPVLISLTCAAQILSRRTGRKVSGSTLRNWLTGCTRFCPVRAVEVTVHALRMKESDLEMLARWVEEQA